MPGVLCEHCTGVCCKYIALPIDTPSERSDFDDVRWYLLHEGISVFVEDGDWYISVQSVCRHLQPDNRCGIYQTRPRICREYTTDNCDYHSGDYGWEQHFTCPEHLDAYVVEWEAANGRRRRPRAGKKPGRAGVQSGRPIRGRLRVRKRPRRPDLAAVLTAARSDLRGVPLPVLPAS